MVKFKILHPYAGLFNNATIEPGVEGYSLFDTKNTFIGYICEEGFLVNGKYPHKSKITSMIRERSIPVFDYDDFYEKKHANELAEILYGEPR